MRKRAANSDDDIPICPKCSSNQVVKNGSIRQKQRYKCKDCHRLFVKDYRHIGNVVSDIGHLFSLILFDKIENPNVARYDIAYLAKSLNFAFDQNQLEIIRSEMRDVEYTSEIDKHQLVKNYSIALQIEGVRITVSFGNYIHKG